MTKVVGDTVFVDFSMRIAHWPGQVATSYTRRNSCFDVNIICAPDHFCHPVDALQHIFTVGERLAVRSTCSLYRDDDDDDDG